MQCIVANNRAKVFKSVGISDFNEDAKERVTGLMKQAFQKKQKWASEWIYNARLSSCSLNLIPALHSRAFAHPAPFLARLR